MNRIEGDAGRNITDVAAALQSNIGNVTQAIELTKNDHQLAMENLQANFNNAINQVENNAFENITELSSSVTNNASVMP